MQIQKHKTNTPQNFKAGINFFNHADAFNTFAKGSVSVNHPWTAREIVKALRAGTTRIKTCTGCGIKTAEGDVFEVVLSHINPKPFSPKTPQSSFKEVRETILEKLSGREPLEALLIGSKECLEESTKLFEDFEAFIRKELGIPCSRFKGLPMEDCCGVHIAYNGINDNWGIFSPVLRAMQGGTCRKNLGLFFDEVSISPKDRLNFIT